MSLNISSNKYCCSRCGAGGFSIGLYAKVRNIDNKKAYRELLDRKCFSLDKSNITISPINELADIETRDMVYRTFLNMLKLEMQHKNYLQGLGFLDSTISEQLYRSLPTSKTTKYIKRRLIANKLKNMYNLCGIPGFYQEEDWLWTFSNGNGFFVPVFDENNRIQSLSIHLDKEFNGTSDLWFSSSGKINGTGVKNWISKNNIQENTEMVVITDSLLLGNFIKATTEIPTISFSNIANSYQIRRIFRDLLPLGYNLEVKSVKNFQDVLKDDFLTFYAVEKAA